MRGCVAPRRTGEEGADAPLRDAWVRPFVTPRCPPFVMPELVPDIRRGTFSGWVVGGWSRQPTRVRNMKYVRSRWYRRIRRIHGVSFAAIHAGVAYTSVSAT